MAGEIDTLMFKRSDPTVITPVVDTLLAATVPETVTVAAVTLPLLDKLEPTIAPVEMLLTVSAPPDEKLAAVMAPLAVRPLVPTM